MEVGRHVRKTEKNLGVPLGEIRERLAQLLGNAAHWLKNKTYDVDECAVRFHYELVLIHPFPNGNGRHARLLADVVAVKGGRPEFSWGSKKLTAPGEAMNEYLSALRTADKGDFAQLPYAGTDFLIVRDGRIAAIYLFFDKLP